MSPDPSRCWCLSDPTTPALGSLRMCPTVTGKSPGLPHTLQVGDWSRGEELARNLHDVDMQAT
jgi:hypothetical protein